jgi:hypothetical protein
MLPAHCITEHGTKELPFTVSVNVGEPAGMVVGVPTWRFGGIAVCKIEVMTGGGRLPGVVRVKSTELDGAGPDGLVTETGTVFGIGNAVSADEIEAVSCVALPKVVVRGEPFQFTVEPFTKFAPFTVKVKPLGWQYGDEANEVAGAESDEMVGAGPAGG